MDRVKKKGSFEKNNSNFSFLFFYYFKQLLRIEVARTTIAVRNAPAQFVKKIADLMSRWMKFIVSPGATGLL